MRRRHGFLRKLFSRAPDFYKFQRGLEALKKGFEQNSRIVITNDDPFLAPIR